MRLLPVWSDHVGGGPAREQPTSDRFRYRQRHVRQHLPLRNLFAHSRCHQAGRAIHRARRPTMNLDRTASEPADSDRSSPSRRRFLQTTAAAGVGLMLSLRFPFTRDVTAADAPGFAPNAFIHIGTDGQVVLTMPYVEM